MVGKYHNLKMNMRLIIIGLIFASSLNAQFAISYGSGVRLISYNSQTYGVQLITDSVLIVAWGESNSGGQADNAEATSGELSPTSVIKMLNTSTLAFNDLDIGTNNNLNHFNLDPTTHGWVLELSNVAKNKEYFINEQVFYTETGQGGSTIDEWATDDVSGYWDDFIERINASYLTLGNIETIVFVSFGINNFVPSTDTATYHSSMTDLLDRIKVETNTTMFLLGELPGADLYDTVLWDIVSERSDSYLVPKLGDDLDNTYHFSYSGFKTNVQKAIDTIQKYR